jgi:hypothetical protein
MDTVTTPVPLRFGQFFPDDVAAVAAVRRESRRWLELLRRFAGHAEYGARVDLPDVSTGSQLDEPARDVHQQAPRSGSAYMAALAQRHAASAQARAERERLARSLAADGLVADARQTAVQGTGAISFAHLVAWKHADAYRAFMQKVGEADQGSFEAHFTGPWPPYSFVE